MIPRLISRAAKLVARLIACFLQLTTDDCTDYLLIVSPTGSSTSTASPRTVATARTNTAGLHRRAVLGRLDHQLGLGLVGGDHDRLRP